MNSKKLLALIGLFISMFATPSHAQVFWSNYSPSGVTDDIWCVTYANGTFAAVTSQGNLMTSTNGLNWSSQAIDSGVWLVSIAYGNGTWVVVGDKGTILWSSDLKTWVHSVSPTTTKLNGVLFVPVFPSLPNGNLFIAVGDAGTILSSPDAQNWTSQPSGVAGFLHGITYNSFDGPIVICGQNGVLLRGAANGTVFQKITSPTTQNLEAVVNYSYNWQYEQTPVQERVTVAVGANEAAVLHSVLVQFGEMGNEFFSNGVTPGTTATLRGLAYGSGSLVAAGEQGTILTSSDDGATWTQRFSGDSPSTVTAATLLSATYSEPLQRFVITGTGGTILVSNAAPTVFGNVSTRGYVSSTQTFIGGFVVEGTAPRTVLIRADGPVLSTFSVPGPLPDPVLTVYDSKGNVIATNTGWATDTNPTAISTAALEVGAFALPNPGLDSALLLTLQPGAYTAQITSAKGNSGIALFEAYTD
jgi:photosystem II stability/assembly factor-like uncharacterized protein